MNIIKIINRQNRLLENSFIHYTLFFYYSDSNSIFDNFFF